MDDQDLPGPGEPIEYRFLSGGTQNEIYELSRGELRCAMRIPPPSAPAGRDEGIRREWRIIEALTGTDVPHAEAVAVCPDPSVLGRAFYLMGFVDGWSAMDQPGWPAPFYADPAARQGLAYQMAEGSRCCRVDWEARGLHDLGRPPHERQSTSDPLVDPGSAPASFWRGGWPGLIAHPTTSGLMRRPPPARQRDVSARCPGPGWPRRRDGEGTVIQTDMAWMVRAGQR
jgi:hypothetical protein